MRGSKSDIVPRRKKAQYAFGDRGFLIVSQKGDLWIQCSSAIKESIRASR